MGTTKVIKFIEYLLLALMLGFAGTARASSLSEPVSFASLLEIDSAAPTQIDAYGPAKVQTTARLGETTPTARPLLIVHGGCWSNAYSRDHALPMAASLAAAGYDPWIAEYRRVGDPGGGWPGSLEDIEAAVILVAEKTGKSPLLIGHSAGGHLALRAAQNPTLPISGVIGLAPITDLVAYGAQDGSCQSMVAPFMGDEEFEPDERYSDASVNTGNLSVPVRILLGDKDPIVGKDQMKTFDPRDTAIVNGSGHFDLIHPETEAFQSVLSALKTFSHQSL